MPRELERRKCERFVVPGAAVVYRKDGLFFSRAYTENFYPVIDISRGGLRFVCEELLKAGTGLTLKLVIPNEEIPRPVMGKVRWVSTNPDKMYRYAIGVQFNPYGEGKGMNSPETLEKLRALEAISGKAEGQRL